MNEPNQPREGVFSWLVKAGAIVFVAAVLSGVAYGYADYWRQFTERSRLKRELATERIQEDSLSAANRRFMIGAGVGAALGLIYVVRSRIKRHQL